MAQKLQQQFLEQDIRLVDGTLQQTEVELIMHAEHLTKKIKV